MKTDLDWFEFRDILGKRVNDRVWVPLWFYQTEKSDAESPEIGHWEDIVFSRAVAAFDGCKDELMAEECDRFHPYHANRSSRFSGDYLRADTYYVNNIPVGERIGDRPSRDPSLTQRGLSREHGKPRSRSSPRLAASRSRMSRGVPRNRARIFPIGDMPSRVWNRA